jgi:hypothetical protein
MDAKPNYAVNEGFADDQKRSVSAQKVPVCKNCALDDNLSVGKASTNFKDAGSIRDDVSQSTMAARSVKTSNS